MRFELARRLAVAVAQVTSIRPGVKKVLIVLDQAEELVDHEDRLEILRELVDAAGAGSACRVVLTVREGFLARLLRGLDADGRVWSLPLTPMSRASLAAAIEGPAARAGVRLESGLVQEILDDVGSGEALPLLALALDRTFRSYLADRSQILTIERYRRVAESPTQWHCRRARSSPASAPMANDESSVSS